jgi:hypothetical protein
VSEAEQTSLLIDAPAYQVNDSMLIKTLIESGAAIGGLMPFVAAAGVRRGRCAMDERVWFCH